MARRVGWGGEAVGGRIDKNGAPSGMGFGVVPCPIRVCPGRLLADNSRTHPHAGGLARRGRDAVHREAGDDRDPLDRQSLTVPGPGFMNES